MRTNIDIDDRLMSEAMRRSGAATKKPAVEAGLRLLVQTHSQTAIRRLRGKVRWEGDLNESRLGRFFLIQVESIWPLQRRRITGPCVGGVTPCARPSVA